MDDQFRVRDALEPEQKFTVWGWFQSFDSELIYSRPQIHPQEEINKRDRELTGSVPSVPSAYKLQTSEATLWDRSNNLPDLDR
jgi:hypothetical protein